MLMRAMKSEVESSYHMFLMIGGDGAHFDP